MAVEVVVGTILTTMDTLREGRIHCQIQPTKHCTGTQVRKEPLLIAMVPAYVSGEAWSSCLTLLEWYSRRVCEQ
jgi:hypothetical protein